MPSSLAALKNPARSRQRPDLSAKYAPSAKPQLLIGDTLKMAKEDLKANKTGKLGPHKPYSLIFQIFFGGGKFFLTTYLLVNKIIFR
jgi:hypothetical protein